MNNKEHTAGVDEVGRGPLAGPVVAAAVILPVDHTIEGLKDSKLLSEARREALTILIKEQAIAWSVAHADVQEIDTLNILRASLLAMQRAVLALSCVPTTVLVDGTHCPDIPYPCQAIIKGDQKVMSISAASILAKVTRDHDMVAYDQEFHQYGFARHKGYPTKQHLEALKTHGPCAIHRVSYAPVKAVMLEASH